MNIKILLLFLFLLPMAYAVSWNDTVTDWDTQQTYRFDTFTMQVNASGGDNITYWDDNIQTDLDKETGILILKPDDDFVGDIVVRINASNTTLQVSNEVTINFEYVSYYGKPGNISGIGELVVYQSRETDYWLGDWFLIGTFLVLFMAQLSFGFLPAFAVASFWTGIMSYLAYLFDIVLVDRTVYGTVLIVIGAILLITMRRK